MLITIDVGNTRTCIGAFKSDKLAYSWNINTVKSDTADELNVKLKNLIDADGLSIEDISGLCLSCVVPNLSHSWVEVCKILNINCVECSPKNACMVSGSIYKTDAANPDEVGADYIAACVAVKSRTNKPAIVFDFGTATNVAVINNNGAFIGGVILPGLETALNSLISGASALHEIKLNTPKTVVCNTTESCIQSGIIYGEAVRTDGLIDIMSNELGYPLEAFITGGLSGLVAPNIKHPIHHVPNLLHYGLKTFYDAFTNRQH